MSEPKYKIHKASDGTCEVEVYGGDGSDAVFQFGSTQEAEDFVAEERRKLGIDPRWSEDPDD